MATHGRSNHNNRLVSINGSPVGHSESTTSASSATARSSGSQDSKLQQCGKGLDMIENFLATIFGGCCLPSECTGNIEILQERSRRRKQQNSDDPFKAETQRRRRRGSLTGSIPQPPEIRRLALDEEIGTVDLDRTGSLSFLFYQEEAKCGRH